jgi:hypothetical protein
MSRFARFGATLVLGLSSVLALSGPSVAAAAPPPTCTAELVIFTTSPGVESQTGPVLHFRDSGVGGQYTSGFLAGYTLVGAQDIQLNTRTNGSELQGQFVATGPGGSLAIAYTGHADLNTGAATGHFHTTGGTGQFSDFRWEGDITAQLIGPATFHATDTGPCRHGAA